MNILLLEFNLISMKNHFALLSFLLLSVFFSAAQIPHNHHHEKERPIVFPDIPGYKTLKCDLHQHTVFSDGKVWPSIRVEEALRDSMDVISLTDHIEYQPHKADIPHPDRNRSYELAVKAAEKHNLIVVRGSEITRRMPPGHCNAIFLTDANKLLVDDSIEVFREAKKQGAFIFWNHPNWVSQRKDGMATLTDMHRMLIKEGLINGIEIVNDDTYSREALQIAYDHNLTLMGTSDIHGFIDWDYHVHDGGHRPVTLVFAKEKTEAGTKEGLENRRTVVWFKNTLIGKPEYLLPLIGQSLIVKKAVYKGKTQVLDVSVENVSDADFILHNKSPYSLHNESDVVVVKAHETTLIQIKTLTRLPVFDMKFRVMNAVVAPDEYADFTLSIRTEGE